MAGTPEMPRRRAAGPARNAHGHGAQAAGVAILTGHHDRLDLFAQRLRHVRSVEALPFRAVIGELDGVTLLVGVSGMGCPSIARAAMHLVRAGCRVVLRVGGAGPVMDGPQPGDLVVATGAVRHEGTSAHFLPAGWPAAADPRVVAALRHAALAAGLRPWAGVVHTKDSFYGEIDPASSPVSGQLRADWDAWRLLGVICSEMEAAALFAIALRSGLQAGALLRINDVHSESGAMSSAQQQLCDVALHAARVLGEASDG